MLYNTGKEGGYGGLVPRTMTLQLSEKFVLVVPLDTGKAAVASHRLLKFFPNPGSGTCILYTGNIFPVCPPFLQIY